MGMAVAGTWSRMPTAPPSAACFGGHAQGQRRTGRRITAGEDKAYDTADHVANLRAVNVTPHVTQNDSITSTGKRHQSAIDARTTRHEGYGMTQSRGP